MHISLVQKDVQPGAHTPMPAMSGSLLKPPIDGKPLPGVLSLLGQITGWFTAAQTCTDAEVLLSLLPIPVRGTLRLSRALRKA